MEDCSDPVVFSSLVVDHIFQRMSPVILWEISDVTTTVVFLSAGSVTVITTVAMAQMRETAVSS